MCLEIQPWSTPEKNLFYFFLWICPQYLVQKCLWIFLLILTWPRSFGIYFFVDFTISKDSFALHFTISKTELNYYHQKVIFELLHNLLNDLRLNFKKISDVLRIEGECLAGHLTRNIQSRTRKLRRVSHKKLYLIKQPILLILMKLSAIS